MFYKPLCVVFIFSLFIDCTSYKKSSGRNEEIRILNRSMWQANEPRPYKQHVPVRITIHHEGTKLVYGEVAAKKIKRIQVWGMGIDRNWADIPYHFLISPDGSIYEGRDVNTVGETNTEYDPTGHLLISCLGNLEEQEITEAQLNSLIKLIAYSSKKYSLPIETLAAHKDYSKQTSCPGKNLYKYLENGYLKSEAIKIFNKL